MSVYRLSRALGDALQTRSWTICTAESCTGGMLAAAITDVPGSSAWFEQGFVTYSNAAKHHRLKVGCDVLQTYGAVSEPVVRAMARGALAVAGADLAVAVSGIAGPAGGSKEKPVGTVWIGWANRYGAEKAHLHHFRGTRRQVREAALLAALDGTIRLIHKEHIDHDER